jgi:hypothetical protein
MLCAGLSAGIMGSSSAATNDTINGAVFDMASNALLDSVLVSSEGTSTRTMPNGSFTLILPNASGVITQNGQQQQRRGVEWNCAKNSFFWPENSGEVSIVIRNCAGRTEARFHSVNSMTNTSCSIANLSQGSYIATIHVGSQTTVYRICKFQNGIHNSLTMVSQKATDRNLAKTGTVRPHLLVFSKAGYNPDSITVAAATTTAGIVTARLLGVKYSVLFDGKDLTNWVYDTHTSIKTQDTAILITGCWCMAWTKLDYDNFRLFVTSRVVNPADAGNGQLHNGVGFWGARDNTDFAPTAGGGCLELTTQNCWMWDYKNNNSGPETNCNPAFQEKDWSLWQTTEVLCNLKNGTVKTAVDGVKAIDARITVTGWVKGPVGVQDHGSNPIEYRNIYIEANPVDTNLVSVKK